MVAGGTTTVSPPTSERCVNKTGTPLVERTTAAWVDVTSAARVTVPSPGATEAVATTLVPSAISTSAVVHGERIEKRWPSRSTGTTKVVAANAAGTRPSWPSPVPVAARGPVDANTVSGPLPVNVSTSPASPPTGAPPSWVITVPSA